MVTNKVTSPQIIATYDDPPTIFVLFKSLIALPARDKPIIATVGPITTAGINLFIQLTPEIFTIIAITTYTRPAKIAPIMRPR